MASKSAVENLRTSIRAEDARATLAQKRRIYANCLATITDYAIAANSAAGGTELPPAQRAELLEESSRARSAALNAVSEVDLIAPPEVTIPAHRAAGAVFRADQAGNAADIEAAIANLTTAMRRDLGADDDSAGELVIAPAPRNQG